jgi:hypothetical protein
MKYSTPELVVLGPAPVLVQGVVPGEEDHPGSESSRPFMGLVLGLDE